MATIAEKVKSRQRLQLQSRGSFGPRRSLLVLDHCERYLMVGEERVELAVLLERLFRALPDLAAAVTMRCGPGDPTAAVLHGGLGVRGEKVVVVEGLSDKRYVT